ncbi:hypothetical protein [Acidicapsa acidisoli]|uniref:hypothetical protein n=1 Tax=Acidicapsa acidisoli TaxID=1615681 RepID=UPI0021E0C7B9|nr:hypothetical protein [Acidicapsa acidisoli]
MHWNTEQILWALVLAAHLVLLIVLLGRDRVARFPWFSTVTVLSTVHLIADHLLHGKLTSLAFYWQTYTAVLLESILGILVLIELARHVFSNCKAPFVLNSKGWLGWTLVTGGVALGAVWLWGPWPTWKALSAEPKQLPLLLVVLTAMKAQLFLSIVTVEAALLLRIFGKRFGSGWKSHDQQIALGLSTYALGFLAVQATTDIIKHNLHLTSREQYEHIVRLFTNLDNGRFALWLLVLIWWIVWLWRNESGDPAALTAPVETPALDAPRSLDTEIP